MKRSEVVEIIVATMNNYHPINSSDITEVSDKILRAIEEVGMIPPSYTERMSCGCCSSYQEGSWEKE